MKILVSGSLSYDRIMDFPGYFKDHILPEKIHILNVSFCAETLRESFGGTAGNIAYNLGLLGERPVIISQAGPDFFKYNDWFIKNGLYNLSVKIYKNQPTALCYIITDRNDNQITGFFPGAMKYPAVLDLKKIKGAKIAIVAPGNTVDMIRLPRLYKKLKIPYIFDFGQQITILSINDLKEAILGARAVVGNDYEISLMLKKTGFSKKRLFRNIDLIVTTLGPRGSIFETKKKRIKIPPAKPKNESDPTGAGDAFRAGLIKGLILGLPLDKIGKLASVVSVYTVEKYGTQTHHFSWPSIRKRYYQNYKEKL